MKLIARFFQDEMKLMFAFVSSLYSFSAVTPLVKLNISWRWIIHKVFWIIYKAWEKMLLIWKYIYTYKKQSKYLSQPSSQTSTSLHASLKAFVLIWVFSYVVEYMLLFLLLLLLMLFGWNDEEMRLKLKHYSIIMWWCYVDVHNYG